MGAVFRIWWSAFKWLFVRQPYWFSIPFALMCLLWMAYAADFLVGPAGRFAEKSASYVIELVTGPPPPDLKRRSPLAHLDDFIRSSIIFFGFFLGFLAAYNIAVAVNRLALWFGLKHQRYEAGKPNPPIAPVQRPGAALAGVRKIGIVLAGGGAKGAFQAGAMKAIYRFLDENGALDKVKVIAGTSIGSWNAMFWLAHLIKGNPDFEQPGIHERWWKRINARSLVAPAWYVPLTRNSFLSSEPWEDVFDHLFGNDDVKSFLHRSRDDISFYLTRTNVRSGRLHCATNNPRPPVINKIRYDILPQSLDADGYLRRLKTAVFSSMDLPPLFPYIDSNGELYEDGGVIDNLPISFAAAERCDLIFVLPLNSDFEDEPSQRSVIGRLNRVLDMQQGVLERHGFKLLYLYNELAALRECVDAAEQRARAGGPEGKASRLDPLGFSLQRTHQKIRVFAVCPHKAFVQGTINTRDLWNHKGAQRAFDVMEHKTAELLAGYAVETEQDRVRVAIVTRAANHTWDDNF